MNSLLDNLLIFTAVDNIDIELKSKDLLYVFSANGMFVVVVDQAIVVIVADQKLVDCLVEI